MLFGKLIKSGIALAAVLSVSACIPSSGGGGGDSGGGFVEYLIGGLTATPATVAAGGSFTAGWNVVGEFPNEPGDNFTVNLYVSPDTTKLAGTQVYSVTCGFGTACTIGAGSAACSYSAAGALSCGTGAGTDISAMVSAAAGSVNLVAEVCQFTLCGTSVSTPLSLEVLSSARAYTDLSGDESGGAGSATHIDMTSLSVSSDATTVSTSITVTGPLPTVALNLNAGNVANGELEMAWGIQFDIDGDGTSANDIGLIYGHRQDDAVGPTTGTIIGTSFNAELLTFDALGNPTVSAGDVLSVMIMNNTITISGTTTTAPSLSAITGAATAVPVRFDSAHDANSDAYPDAGGLSNYVN